MARIKKFLAAISAVVTLCTMSVCSINVSALAYRKVDGTYYTEREIEKLYGLYGLFLDLDESIATTKVSEDNEVIYVLNTDSELYNYMKDNLGILSNEFHCTYAKYDSETNTYKTNDVYGNVFSDEEIYKFKTLNDKELADINVKRVATIYGCFGLYHNKLSIVGNYYDLDSDLITFQELIEKEINPLSGVDYATGYGVMPLSTIGEPVDVEPLTGDLSMDGKVNIVDAVKLAKYNADPTAYPLLTYSQLAADVNGDGELTNSDLIALVKMI